MIQSFMDEKKTSSEGLHLTLGLGWGHRYSPDSRPPWKTPSPCPGTDGCNPKAEGRLVPALLQV